MHLCLRVNSQCYLVLKAIKPSPQKSRYAKIFSKDNFLLRFVTADLKMQRFDTTYFFSSLCVLY
jgi:hypothetical protein